VREALDTTERLLGSVAWSASQANVVAAALVDASRRGGFPDPASAEQAAMGMVVLLAGMNLDRAKRSEIDSLFDELRDDNAFDQRRFAEWMSVLNDR
jgi:hypothetical protein